MQTKLILTEDDVKRIVAAAEDEARRHQWKVVIAIVDDGGHLLWLQRMDDVALVSIAMAQAKARSAALGRRESKVYEDMINNGRISLTTAPELEGLIEGGVPLLAQGQVVGAIGVSGVRAVEDAQIARAGAAVLADLA